MFKDDDSVVSGDDGVDLGGLTKYSRKISSSKEVGNATVKMVRRGFILRPVRVQVWDLGRQKISGGRDSYSYEFLLDVEFLQQVANFGGTGWRVDL